MRNEGGRCPTWKLAVFWCFMLVAVAPGMFGFALSMKARFENPDMTETRLFMKCWAAYLAQVVSAFWGVGLWAERPWRDK